MRRHPDRIAIDDGSAPVTYAALAAAAARLAAVVATSAAGEAIGVLAPQSAWLVLGALGSLAAGRPYLPLDSRYPAERNLAILEDAGIKTLLVHGRSGRGDLPIPAGIRRIEMAEVLSPDAPPPEFAPSPFGPDAPAVILYTSGSTGRQKGIVNGQRAVLKRVFQHAEAAGVDADDVFLPLSSFCTIAGTRECYAALLTGAKLVLADPERTGFRELRRLVRAHGVTVVYSFPKLLRSLIEAGDDTADFASVRLVRTGGETVLWSDIDLIRQAMPASCLIQAAYSSTETPGSQWFIPRHCARNGACAPAGYPVPGLLYAVLDAAGADVAPGEVGELVIRSRYVALGEWRGGRMVAGRMQPHADGYSRVFATGDLVRFENSGLMVVSGRKDSQVKIAGTRVEPAELEAVLRRVPGVADAAVLVRGEGTAVRLVAFVAGEGKELREAVRKAVRAALPVVLHPARLHVVSAVPRLPSGKVDPPALERMDEAAQAPEATLPEPDAAAHMAGAVEVVWRRVLRRPPADGLAWDEVGGDSLQLLRFVFELEEALGVDLPLELFRTDMTPAEFVAAATRRGRPAGDDDARSAIVMFPGLTGDSPATASLRVDLEDSFRFVTIGYPEWQEMARRATTLGDLAVAAAGQIGGQVADGKLQLVGYSLGGAVAYETAGLLAAAGREIDVLVILDTYAGAVASQNWRHPDFGRMLRRGLRASVTEYACRAAARLLARPRREAWLERLARTGLGWLPAAIRFALHQELTQALQLRALEDWIRRGPPPTRSPARAVLFRSQRPMPAADLGWGPYLDRLEIVDVPGDHVSMLRPPHRASVAARLFEILRRDESRVVEDRSNPASPARKAHECRNLLAPSP